MSRPFRILGVHHIGLAPKVPVATQHFFSLLGLSAEEPERVESQKVVCTQFHATSSLTEPHALLEILVPTSKDSPISKFLLGRKGGLHHLALEVDDICAAVTYLQGKQVAFLSETPISGSHGTQVIFIHPGDAGGLLVELVQQSPSI